MANAAALYAYVTPGQNIGAIASSPAGSLVSLISWLIAWSDVETAQGTYVTQPILDNINAAAALGYASSIIIVPGYKAPSWVTKKGSGVASVTLPAGSGPGSKPIVMPVPWDPALVSLYTTFQTHLGAALASNPHLKLVQSTGGGIQGEMQLPHDTQAVLSIWGNAGYSDQKLLTAWQGYLNGWHSAFPGIPASLAIEEPLGQGNSNVLGPLTNWCKSAWGGKQWLQQNGLTSSVTPDSGYGADLLAASAYTTVGWQMNGVGTKANGPMNKAFDAALETHASFVEVYTDDITNHANLTALQHLVAGVL